MVGKKQDIGKITLCNPLKFVSYSFFKKKIIYFKKLIIFKSIVSVCYRFFKKIKI